MKKFWLSILIFVTSVCFRKIAAFPAADISTGSDEAPDRDEVPDSWDSLKDWLNSNTAVDESRTHAHNSSLDSVKKWLEEDIGEVKRLLNSTEEIAEGYLTSWLSIVSKHSTVKYWLENLANASKEMIETVEKDAFEYLQQAKDEISSLTEALDNAATNVSDRIHSVVDPVIVEKYMIETVCRIAGVKNCDSQCEHFKHPREGHDFPLPQHHTDSNASDSYINPVICYVCCNGTINGDPLPPPPQDESTKKMTQWFIEAFKWLGLHPVYQFTPPQRENRKDEESVISVIETFNLHYHKKPTFLNQFSPKTQFVSEDVCGYYSSGEKKMRILGGTEVTSEGVYPWQLSLATATFGMFYQHRCGATLLSSRWVLTAAHCMNAMKKANTVVMGGFLSQNEQNVAQIRKIERVIMHPKFDDVLFEQDIALIKLREPMIYSSIILPACLPEPDSDHSGSMAMLTGWGREWENGPLTEQLNEAALPVISNQECMQWYRESKSPQFIPERTFLCAGVQDGSKDACSGDSGGPLVFYRKDKRAEVIGIVSWGIGCGGVRRPGVYTRVTKYLDWINKNMMWDRGHRLAGEEGEQHGEEGEEHGEDGEQHGEEGEEHGEDGETGEPAEDEEVKAPEPEEDDKEIKTGETEEA